MPPLAKVFPSISQARKKGYREYQISCESPIIIIIIILWQIPWRPVDSRLLTWLCIMQDRGTER